MTETFHAAAAVVTDWLLATTVHVAVLFALVLAASAALGSRLPVRWRHALWALVLVRLLLPALPSSPVSVHNVARLVTPRAPVADVRTRVPQPVGHPVGDAALAQLAPSAGAGAGAVAVAADAPQAPAPVPAPAWPWRSTVFLVWLLGAAAALARLLATELRFAWTVRRLPVVRDERVRAALAQALRAAGARRPAAVVATDLGGGPALTGLRRPRILFPQSLLDELTDDELRHVLAHEVAHLAAGDVLQNWLLAVLAAVHWFDPLVRIAAARLRAERETLRDLAATKGATRACRAAYGKTLLRLLSNTARPASPRVAVGLFERRGDVRRRIEMIAKGGGGRRAWLLGAGLTAVVAVAALTGASPRAARAQEAGQDGRGPPAAPDETAESGESGVGVARAGGDVRAALLQDRARIVVERRTPPRPWDARVKAALAKPVKVNLNGTSVEDFLDFMSRVTELNIVVHPDVAAESTITLVLDGSLSADQVLRLALGRVGLTYGVVEGVLQVGEPGVVAEAHDQRFYKIAPLVDGALGRLPAEAGAEQRAAYRDSVPDMLTDLIHRFVDEPAWERDGVHMNVWRGMLVIEQDERTHAAVEEFLNLLLSRGASLPPPPAWRAALEARLAKRASIDFQGAPISTVVAYLAQSTGASIVVSADAGDDVALSLRLADVTALEALNCDREPGGTAATNRLERN